jgi:S1-C subfamily serine protease
MALSTALAVALLANYGGRDPHSHFHANSVPSSVLSSHSPQGVLPRRGSIGLAFSPVPPEEAAKHSLKPGQGLVAVSPVPGLAAAAAGVVGGDILLSLNGKEVGPGLVGEVIRDIAVGAQVRDD